MSVAARDPFIAGRCAAVLVATGLLAGQLVVAQTAPTANLSSTADAARPSPRPPSPVVPRSNVLTPEPWKGASFEPLTPAELDRLVAAELQADKATPAPRTTDEAFLRRVTLDLAGTLPTPQDVQAFVADGDPAKRAKVIDKLLAGDASA